MARSHFKASCTELFIYIFIVNNGDGTPYPWYYYLFSLKPLITLVLRMNADSSISKNSFRSCRGYYNILICLTLNKVANIIQLALRLVINNLLIRNSCFSLWIPINHSYSTVDKSLAIKVAENVYHRFTTCLIHGKGQTIPIA